MHQQSYRFNSYIVRDILSYLEQSQYAKWLLTHKNAKQFKYARREVKLTAAPKVLPEHWFWGKQIVVSSPWTGPDMNLPGFDIEFQRTLSLTSISSISCRSLKVAKLDCGRNPRAVMKRMTIDRLTLDEACFSDAICYITARTVVIHNVPQLWRFFPGMWPPVQELHLILHMEPKQKKCAYHRLRYNQRLKSLTVHGLKCPECVTALRSWKELPQLIFVD